jgi:AcrR family transcriptional regulator
MSAESTNPTKKSLQRQKTMAQIIDGAITVFREKGFENANVVDITGAAGVAMGSLNNCFGNKERLGAYVTLATLKHTMQPVHATVGFEDNPVLFALAAISTYHRFMTETGGYRQFFIDSLKHDFMFNYLSKHPNRHAINLIRHHFCDDIDEDTAMLRSLYMPYMLGRTLILKQQEGYFNGVSICDIASLMCREAWKDHVPEEVVRSLIPEGMRIAGEICEGLADRPSMQTIETVARAEI